MFNSHLAKTQKLDLSNGIVAETVYECLPDLFEIESSSTSTKQAASPINDLQLGSQAKEEVSYVDEALGQTECKYQFEQEQSATVQTQDYFKFVNTALAQIETDI